MEDMRWWSWLVLCGIGLLGGTIGGLGIGGGSLLIPLLWLSGRWMGPAWPQKEAQGANLLSFLPAAVLALIGHIRGRRVAGKPLLWLLPGGLAGAIGGAWLAASVDGTLLQRVFGGFLLLMAAYEAYGAFREKDKEKSASSP